MPITSEAGPRSFGTGMLAAVEENLRTDARVLQGLQRCLPAIKVIVAAHEARTILRDLADRKRLDGDVVNVMNRDFEELTGLRQRAQFRAVEEYRSLSSRL